MATPITDEEIARHPIPGAHGSRRWCCDDCSWKYEEKLRERIRADREEIARLRAVADAARALVGWDWLRLLPDTRHGVDVADGVDAIETALAALDAGDTKAGAT